MPRAIRWPCRSQKTPRLGILFVYAGNVSTAVRQIQKPPTRFVNQLLGTENEISPATGAYTFNMKPV